MFPLICSICFSESVHVNEPFIVNIKLFCYVVAVKHYGFDLVSVSV